MKIKFTINYKTNFGQVLKIKGSVPELGANNVNKAIEMVPVDGKNGDWDCIVNIEDKNAKRITYKYFIDDRNFEKTYFEWGNEREINLKNFENKDILVQDFWRSNAEPENAFFSSAFSKILFKRKKSRKKASKKADSIGINVNFKLNNFRVNANHFIGIIGNIAELGAWNKSKYVLLDDFRFPEWSKSISVKKVTDSVIYKYCIVDKKSKKIIVEENKNRIIPITKKTTEKIIICSDEKFQYPSGNWKGAGVAIPVFSLRTKNGHGVGEFLDIKLLVDWAVKTGLKLIQILPINDTVATQTWHDSYPYAAISVLALHPIYLNLKAIGNLSSEITQEVVEEQKVLLNQKEKVDYDAVMKIKSRFYKLIYDEQKEDFLKNPEFLKFFKENKEWLKPYAAYSYLRDLFGTPDFSKWGRFCKVSNTIINEITNDSASHYDDIAIHYFIQYHLHIQLLEVAEYARKKGIVLKGDIPIGIFRHSVDAWVEPHLYNMNAQAGAPPDDFSDLGQNWQFPTYNWNEMAKDGYKWWKNRMKKMSTYFDAFRIDHILGFFRIWEIPQEQNVGLMGYFNPSIPIYRDEFDEKGIYFDVYRYCTPFIRDYMLGNIFGDLAVDVKNEFLIEYEFGKFYIKEEYNTQKKIEKHLNIADSDVQELKNRKRRILNGMYKLISEVLFLKYPHTEEETFVPRHSLYKTYSFGALNQFEKQKVMELYDDYYFRRNEDFWKEQAYIKLPPIKEATEMLICGEDLGMIPKSVPSVMSDLGILSLEIQRMPKDSNIEFAHPNDFPYLSVATTSSHDTSTIRGWWEEDSALSQRFYNNILGNIGSSPFFCEPWVVNDIINQHIYCPSMWTIFPIQDLLALDENLRFWNAKEERINVPSNANNYWQYRLHLNLEDLLNETKFNNRIKKMLTESGRVDNY